MSRSDKLNYYKFGLGLGDVSGPVTGEDGKSSKHGGGGAAEAAAGTADQ